MGMKYKDEIKEIREVDVKNVKEKTKYYDFVNIQNEHMSSFKEREKIDAKEEEKGNLTEIQEQLNDALSGGDNLNQSQDEPTFAT